LSCRTAKKKRLQRVGEEERRNVATLREFGDDETNEP